MNLSWSCLKGFNSFEYIFIALKLPKVCIFLPMPSLCSVRCGSSLLLSFRHHSLVSRKPWICFGLPRNSGKYPWVIINRPVKGSLVRIHMQISDCPQLGLSAPTNPSAHPARCVHFENKAKVFKINCPERFGEHLYTRGMLRSSMGRCFIAKGNII